MTSTDPFAGGTSVPSLSFKDAPIGTTYTGTIVEPAELVQSRDFETGEPAYWPANPGQTPNPKMAAVVKLLIDGEERAVWAVKPSALFAAIEAAKKKAGGGPLEVGGTLAIRYTSDKPNDNPRLNPAKQYQAIYTPPDAFASATAAVSAIAAPPAAADQWGNDWGNGEKPF